MASLGYGRVWVMVQSELCYSMGYGESWSQYSLGCGTVWVMIIWVVAVWVTASLGCVLVPFDGI